MANHSTHAKCARRLLSELTDQKLSLIDFDHWRRWLHEVAELLDDADRLQQEVTILRQDYLARIGGMVKAIAALQRNHRERDRAMTFVRDLPALTAEELVEQYRRTHARFHDAFPATFGFLPGRKRGDAGISSFRTA